MNVRRSMNSTYESIHTVVGSGHRVLNVVRGEVLPPLIFVCNISRSILMSPNTRTVSTGTQGVGGRGGGVGESGGDGEGDGDGDGEGRKTDWQNHPGPGRSCSKSSPKTKVH